MLKRAYFTIYYYYIKRGYDFSGSFLNCFPAVNLTNNFVITDYHNIRDETQFLAVLH